MNENDRFIRISEVRSLIGLKDSRIYQMIKDGAFPRPIKLGTASRWSMHAVQAWMDQQIRSAA